MVYSGSRPVNLLLPVCASKLDYLISVGVGVGGVIWETRILYI